MAKTTAPTRETRERKIIYFTWKDQVYRLNNEFQRRLFQCYVRYPSIGRHHVFVVVPPTKARQHHKIDNEHGDKKRNIRIVTGRCERTLGKINATY